MADKKISALTAATTPLAGTEVLPIVQSGSTVKVANNDLRPKQIQSNATSGVLQVVGPAAATTRVMTVPNANFTAARTDAGQTFSGNQVISGNLTATGDSFIGTDNGGTKYYFGTFTNAAGLANSAYFSPGLTDINEPTNFMFQARDASGDLYNVLKVGSNWDVTAVLGNFVQGTAAKGVNFTANTPAAGMTSQLLNWYEEGTWTPAYATTGNPYTSVTYGIQSGTYTRIGRMVSIKLRIRTSAVTIGSASGALIITGLPFTSAASGCPVTIGYADSFSTNAPINAEVNGSATTIALYYRATVGGSVVSMQYNYLGTGATDNDLTIAGFYYV